MTTTSSMGQHIWQPLVPEAAARVRGARARGMALVAVLWMVAALSLIVLGMSHSVRIETRLTGHARQSLIHAAFGEAAIALALQDLGTQSQGVSALTRVQKTFEGLPIEIEFMPLSGLIDLNHAPLPLLVQLFVNAAGLDLVQAESLAQGLIGLREAKDVTGRRIGLASIEDLLRSPGMNHDIYAAVAPMVTTEGQTSGKVNPLAASQAVLTVLAQGRLEVAQAIAAARDRREPGVDTTSLNAAFVDQGNVSRYRITARVPLPDGGHLLTIWQVNARPDLAEGLPWRVYQAEQRVEPPPPRPV